MSAHRIVSSCVIGMVLAAGSWVPAQAQQQEEYLPGPEPVRQSAVRMTTETGRPMEGVWRGGSGVGFLADSPDGAAVAFAGDLDYGLNEYVSVGPLAQLSFTDDMLLFGLSGGAKYWLPISDEARMVLQSGLGFVHADFRGDDTSWLIPLGIGYDYTLGNGTNLTATALVNFTDLHTGGGSGADVMPGFLLGLRF